jgi:hypothetical protein
LANSQDRSVIFAATWSPAERDSTMKIQLPIAGVIVLALLKFAFKNEDKFGNQLAAMVGSEQAAMIDRHWNNGLAAYVCNDIPALRLAEATINSVLNEHQYEPIVLAAHISEEIDADQDMKQELQMKCLKKPAQNTVHLGPGL